MLGGMGAMSQKRGKSQSGALPGNAHKLAQAINTNFIKVDTVSVGMGKKGGQGVKGQDEDPSKAINDFDDKLAEITAMLNKYNDQAKEERREGSRGATGNKGHRSPTGRAARKKEEGPTEEEAYLNQRIHRRAQSLGPGAPMSLNVKVAQYRTDPLARAHLAERCTAHQKVLEEAECRKKALQTGTHDFIQANLLSLRQDPEPYLSRMHALATPSASMRARPWSSHAAVGAHAARPWSAAQLSSAASSRPGTSAGPSRPAAAPHPHPHARPASARPPSAQRPLVPTVLSLTPHGVHVGGGGAAAPSASFTQHHPPGAAALAIPEHLAVAEGHVPVPSVFSSTSPRSTSPETALLLREARLTITARPASGGSPTRRQDFLAQRGALAAIRAEHAEEVRVRHDELQEYKQQRAEMLAEQRQAREAAEQARRQEQAAKEELQRRHNEWAGVTHLAFKLAFLKQEVLAARKLRPLRDLRKEAAVKIATWYKHLLDRRHIAAMMELIKRVDRLLKGHVVRKREEVRRKCAGRIVHFLQMVKEGGAATAVSALAQFQARIRYVQQAWRVAYLVRKTQRAILYAHFSRYEKHVLRRNSHKGQAEELAARQRLRSASKHHAPPVAAGAAEGHEGGPPSPTHDTPASPGAGLGGRSKKAAEVEDPLLEALLATHKQPLPKDVRLAVVHKTLLEMRQKFQRQMQAYGAAMELYRLQLPMEELRIRLLQDAGLEATNSLKKPVHPVMLVLAPKPTLKRMLQDGINMVEEKKVQEQQQRRELAEQLWNEAQAAKQQAQAAQQLQKQAAAAAAAAAQQQLQQVGNGGGAAMPDEQQLQGDPHPNVARLTRELLEAVASPASPPRGLAAAAAGGASKPPPLLVQQGAHAPGEAGTAHSGAGSRPQSAAVWAPAQVARLQARPMSAAPSLSPSDVLPVRGRFALARERQTQQPPTDL